jgi:Ca-activated chloride channel homolog
MHQLTRRLFLGSAAGAALSAQDEDPVFRSETRLVVLYATVVDSKGRLVTTLPASAFEVQENNAKQPLRFCRVEDVPVSLGVVIDNSGSMRGRRKKVEAAALAMVKASNRLDEVSVINFNEEAYEDVPLTPDIKAMEEGISRLDSRGGTALYDATAMTIDYLKEKGKRDKKVIMIISDGADTASRTTLEKVIEKAHSTDVVIHAIGMLRPEEGREAKKAKRALEAITKASGGLCFLPSSEEEVEKLALQVAQDIRNQYVIGYSPINQALDGSFRAIRVKASGPNRPTVRTRSGYFATAGALKGGKGSSR